MPFRFPFFPYYFNRPFNNYASPSKNSSMLNHPNNINFSNAYTSNPSNNITDKHNNNEKKYSEKENLKNSSTEYFFELFGIHLFFDDILIICLLFFLYEEKVKDDGIFICLVLLLLTK